MPRIRFLADNIKELLGNGSGNVRGRRTVGFVDNEYDSRLLSESPSLTHGNEMDPNEFLNYIKSYLVQCAEDSTSPEILPVMISQ